jgi:hypothetical protein
MLIVLRASKARKIAKINLIIGVIETICRPLIVSVCG